MVSVATMTLGMALVMFAAPPPTVACSCAMPDQPMRAASTDPSISVFTGIAGPLGQAGMPVRLTRWFQGAPPPSGVAVLDPAGFEDPMGGSCGTTAPGAGTEWIFVTGRNSVGRYEVSLCTTHAALDTDWGRDLLTEALAVFGPAVVPETPPAPSDPDPLSTLAAVLPIALAALGALGLIVGLFGLAGRRRGRSR